MKILLHAPERRIFLPLLSVFNQMGIWSELCHCPNRTCQLCNNERYDAFLLWHDQEPEHLLERFKAWKRASTGGQFVVLTNRQSGLERARALEAGIDHYLIEPFSCSKLVGDLLLQEYRTSYDEPAAYVTNHFSINLLARTATCDGAELRTTKREFDILAYLLKNRGYTLSRLQIWEEVWGYDQDMSMANPIDVSIGRLRRKLPKQAQHLIRTVHGTGYRMHAEA